MKKIPMLLFLIMSTTILSQTVVTFKDQKFIKVDVSNSELLVNLTGGEYKKDVVGSTVKDPDDLKDNSIDIGCKVLSLFYPLEVEEEYPTYGRYGDETRVFCICNEIYYKLKPSPSGGNYWAPESTFFGRINQGGVIKVAWEPNLNVSARY